MGLRFTCTGFGHVPLRKFTRLVFQDRPMNADVFLELSAGTYMRFRTCIFSRSDVPRPFLPFGQSGTPDDFRTFFPEQDTIFDTQNWLKPHNLQTKGVRSSYCGGALFVLAVFFCFGRSCRLFVAAALGMRLRGSFPHLRSMQSTCHRLIVSCT